MPYPSETRWQIREQIAARLDAGRLPGESPERMFSLYHGSFSCDACDGPIGTTGVQYEFDPLGFRAARFHLECAGLWEAERRRRSQPAPSVPNALTGLADTPRSE